MRTAGTSSRITAWARSIERYRLAVASPQARCLFCALFSVLGYMTVLVWAADAGAQFLSPGALSAPHSKLEGDSQCSRCHTSGRGVSNAKCTSCHQSIAASQSAGSGLHGRKFKGQPCARCHSDHHGRGFGLIRWNPKSLNHAETGWPLRGAHAKVACNQCHKQRSYMGLGKECASCHKDPHQGRLGKQCTSCHGESTWKQVALEAFDHSQTRFPLRGGHQKTDCDACHGKPPRYRGLEFAACANCHDDPHQGRFAGTCESCHSEQNWHRVSLGPGTHRQLSLANGHARVQCRTCHDRGTLVSPTRGRGCVNCHAPVHEADFGKKCYTCHSNIRWLGQKRKVGLAAHDRTPFPLEGRHESVACDSCHSPKQKPDARFRKLDFDACGDCHSDPHDGGFQARQGGECGPCHEVRGFRPSTFGVALHATTAFPLTGRHDAVPCGMCHATTSGKKERLDWHVGDTACAACHENPHGDQFAKEMKQDGCATCHRPIGWDTPNIKHQSWPLTGAHASARCGRCHTPTEQDRRAGRGPSYRRAPRGCSGCHEDAHRGQFRLSEPKRECNVCHDTTEFRIRAFPHAKLTGYPLEGRHESLSCDACHKKESLRSGATAARWRLGYRRCRDCHADPHAEGTR